MIIVGGIYSVIKSKAPITTAEYGERYTLIGPLNRVSVSPGSPSAIVLRMGSAKMHYVIWDELRDDLLPVQN